MTQTEIEVLVAGALASEEANQDPIDFAFLTETQEKQVFNHVPPDNPNNLYTLYILLNRRTEAVFEQGGQRFRVMKGAVRTIAKTCGLSNSEISPA